MEHTLKLLFIMYTLPTFKEISHNRESDLSKMRTMRESLVTIGRGQMGRRGIFNKKSQPNRKQEIFLGYIFLILAHRSLAPHQRVLFPARSTEAVCMGLSIVGRRLIVE